MGKHAGKKGRALSRRVYAALLAAYPTEFRREYGREMSLVFADRCREEGAPMLRVWRDALGDLARAAARERLESLRRGGGLMKVLRTIALALTAYAFTLVVVAPLYARNIVNLPVVVNSLIDALISTGIIFNFIFLLLTLTRLFEGVRAVGAALAVTTLVVVALITLITVSSGPHARLNLLIVVAQVLSLLFWFAMHLWWVLRKGRHGPPATVA